MQPLSGGLTSTDLRSHEEIDFTIENMQQRKELVDRLAIIGLIEETVELGG
jgi:hypothetical protein